MRDRVVMCVSVRIIDVGCLDGFLACWGNFIVIHTICMEFQKCVFCLCNIL
jgi:hypothetical protein